MSRMNGTAITADTVEAMSALFAGSESAHGTHGEPYQEPGKIKWEIKKSARTVLQPVTPEAWAQHLRGERPLGIIPLRGDGTCTWGSIDVDEYASGDMLELVARAESLGLVPARSKSGGLHLFRFWPEWTPARDVQKNLKALAKQLGLKTGVEVFPKQASGIGNWMVMPYFGSTFGGKLREQVGLKKTGAEMTLDEFLSAAEKARGAVDKKPAAPSDFGGGPLCLQRVAAEGATEGARNDWLFNMGVYARKAHPDCWQAKIDDFNRAYMKPPLSSEEVTGLVKQLRKKAYAYHRDDRTICGDCDRPECRGSYGIGSAGKNIPVFEKVVISEGDETMWDITLGDGGQITLSSDEVFSQRVFNKHCLARLRRAFHPMQEAKWIDLINEAASRATVTDAPPSVTKEEQFRDLLEDFLVNRARGKRNEDLFSGRPWEDEEVGVHYFRMKDFKAYLNRDSSVFKNESHTRLGNFVKKLGGGYKELTIRRRCCATWWVPSSVIHPMPVIEAPPVPGCGL